MILYLFIKLKIELSLSLLTYVAHTIGKQMVISVMYYNKIIIG